MENVIQMATDSSAAKSFVYRRGLGKMRHLEIRDLWLQLEVREGRVHVEKILGTQNPADLMTKVLSTREMEEKLRGMNIRFKRNPKMGKKGDEVNQLHAYGAVQAISQVRNQVSPCACERCPLAA